MTQKTIVVTLIFIFSTFVQLASQIVVTRLFGASVGLDNFLAAVALPTVIVTVIYGTLNDLYLPRYGEQLVKNPVEANGRLLYTIITFGIMGTATSLILGFLSPVIMNMLYQSSRGLNLIEVSRQFSLMVFAFPASILVTLLGVYFYGNKKYYRFPVAQAWGSIANLAFIILTYKIIGIWSLVWAFVVNIILQVPLTLPKLKIKIISYPVWPILLGWVPLIVANLAIRSDTLLIRSFGSQLGNGYLVYLNLAVKIFSLGLGLVTIGIQILFLPNLVNFLANDNFRQADNLVNRAKIISVLLSLVAAVGIYFIAPFVLQILFLGGKFTQTDINSTVKILPFFILPAVGWGITGIFYQPLIALKKYLVMAVINCTGILLAWSVTAALVNSFGTVAAISIGLCVLLFSSTTFSEIAWQIERRKLLRSAS